MRKNTGSPSADSFDGREQPISWHGANNPAVIYQTLLDIKESQGESKMAIQHVMDSLDKSVTRLDDAIAKQSVRLDDAIARQSVKIDLVQSTLTKYKIWAAAIIAVISAVYFLFKLIEPYIVITLK